MGLFGGGKKSSGSASSSSTAAFNTQSNTAPVISFNTNTNGSVGDDGAVNTTNTYNLKMLDHGAIDSSFAFADAAHGRANKFADAATTKAFTYADKAVREALGHTSEITEKAFTYTDINNKRANDFVTNAYEKSNELVNNTVNTALDHNAKLVKDSYDLVGNSLQANRYAMESANEASIKAMDAINTNVKTAMSFARDSMKSDAGQSEDLLKILGWSVFGVAAVWAFGKGK